MIMRKVPVLLVASSLVTLMACSAGQPPSNDQSSAAVSSSSGPGIVGAIDRAMDKASVELATKNITVSNDHDNAPKAEITPQGDFLVAGQPVSLTPAQRREMLAYRQQLIEIARQGIAIGKQGATLGIHAASAAIAAAFSGESEQQVRQRVESQTSGIRTAAAKICDRLPALRASQQQLASDVRAFKPYADVTPAKIDECRENALHDGNSDH
ncbi:MAG TPA: hypothetical protein VJ862_02070 [Rhodanobacteraceae bacterium]|nr:hypothetical protein [Rhodanobacteraceae bacterium]